MPSVCSYPRHSPLCNALQSSPVPSAAAFRLHLYCPRTETAIPCHLAPQANCFIPRLISKSSSRDWPAHSCVHLTGKLTSLAIRAVTRAISIFCRASESLEDSLRLERAESERDAFFHADASRAVWRWLLPARTRLGRADPQELPDEMPRCSCQAHCDRGARRTRTACTAHREAPDRAHQQPNSVESPKRP